MTFIEDENGQGMVEYALVIGLIAVAAVVILIAISPKIKTMFEKTNDAAATAESAAAET